MERKCRKCVQNKRGIAQFFFIDKRLTLNELERKP